MRSNVPAQHRDVLLQAVEIIRRVQLLPVGDVDSSLCTEHEICLPSVRDILELDVECRNLK